MPGPLPSEKRARTNAPTIPTTSLPAAGRSGPVPVCPYALQVRGEKWWKWAWKTPQAAGWSSGNLYTLGRRAQLEDTLTDVEPGPDMNAVLREMRELDDRFGLTPKGMAALRWQIVAPVTSAATSSGNVTQIDDRRARLTGT